MGYIRNTAELFARFGVENKHEFDRAIYKHTECGAWARLIGPGARQVGTRVETWTATCRHSIRGVVCIGVRQRGKRKMSIVDAPQHIREFLLCDADGIMRVDWDQIQKPQAPWVTGVSRRGPLTVSVTFRVDAPVLRPHSGGVLLGSIVEGSNAEVQPEELLFPFDAADLDHALSSIENEADRLWREANEPDADADADTACIHEEVTP